MRCDQKVLGPSSASGYQGMKIWSLHFNIIPLQGNALSPSVFLLAYPFQMEVFFLVPQVTCSLPLWRLRCFQTVFHKGWILVWGTDRSQKGPYQENMLGEEGLQIRIQSQQSWQLATCEQAHCPARAEHLKSIDALSSLNTVIQKQSSVTKCFLLFR